MITSRNSTVCKSWAKMPEREKQQQKDHDRLKDIRDENNGNEGNNRIIQMMWTGVPRHTQYESSLGHTAVYNCVIPYLTALIMTSPEILEVPENKPMNSWPKRNLMALDKMMMNVWMKWAIDLGRGGGQLDKNVGPRPTKYDACQVNRISLNEYDKVE